MPFVNFASPGGKVQSGDVLPIPNVSGMTVSDAKAALTAAGFKPVIGNAVSSTIPVGRVVYTQPGAQALRGTTVVIMTSTGHVPSAKATPTTPKAAPTTPPVRTRWPKCRPGGPRPCRL